MGPAQRRPRLGRCPGGRRRRGRPGDRQQRRCCSAAPASPSPTDRCGSSPAPVNVASPPPATPGWTWPSGDFIAFLDDDAEADPQWLQYLASPFADPRVAGVGGTAVPAWVGAEPPTLVPRRVRVGDRVLIHGPARSPHRDPQPDRRQHGIPPVCHRGCRRVLERAGTGGRSGRRRRGDRPRHPGAPGDRRRRDAGSRRGRPPSRATGSDPSVLLPAALLRRRVLEGGPRGTGRAPETPPRPNAPTWALWPRVLAGVLGEAVARREAGPLLEAGALLAGLAATSAGFLVGLAAVRLGLGKARS